MTPQELKEYFDNNPPPFEVDWKPWAKMVNSKLFIENALMCIEQFNGRYDKCPDYWHLLEFYEDIQNGLLDK